MRSLRSTVAVVETRPETVAADYARLLRLAGLAADREEGRVLADGARPAGAAGTTATPPWQLAAVLVGGCGPEAVYALDGAGRAAGAPDRWRAPLAAAGGGLADAAAWERRRVAGDGLPALVEALTDGPQLPRRLAGRPVLVAAGLGIGGGWPVRGAVELLARLAAPPHLRRRRQRASAAAVAADAVALVHRECGLAGAVIDGVRWHVSDGRWRRTSLLGNVLLAGRDPVAVDAVACRLAGADPQRVPWLRLCAERGLGHADPARIDVVGRTDLAAHDLGLAARLLVPAPGGAWPGAGDGWLQRLRVRRAAPRASGWDTIQAAPAAGRGEES